MNLADFKSNTLVAAYREGLSVDKAFSIVVLGPTGENNRPIQKRITVSFSSPEFAHDASPEELWLNPSNWLLYRLNSTKDAWLEIRTYEEIFFISSSVSYSSGDGSTPFAGNTATGPIYLAGSPQSAMEAANKAYVDQLINTVTANAAVSTPVSTISGLRSIAVTTNMDKRLVFVEEIGILFAYDAQSTDTPNGTTVIAPNSGAGRWKTTTNGGLDGGSF